MSLAIYESADPSSNFSVSGVFTNPFRISLDGYEGGVVQQKLYVRNSSLTTTYSAITVQPIDGDSDGIVDGTALGYSWKLSAGDTKPTDSEWSDVTAGASVAIPSISDTTTYQPFWVRIEVPNLASAQSYDGVVLRISATSS